MLDIEFTIQEGKLYMLQCRVGKRTGVAAMTMALDMLHEGLIDEKEVVLRVAPAQLDELLHPILDAADEKKHTVIAKTGFRSRPQPSQTPSPPTRDQTQAA